jgi:hypothetical protein
VEVLFKSEDPRWVDGVRICMSGVREEYTYTDS